MSEQIKKALLSLDPKEDNHWTADGLPRIDTIKAIVGEGVQVDRAIINAALSGFFRVTAHNFTGGQGSSAPLQQTAPAAPQALKQQHQAPVVIAQEPAVEQPLEQNEFSVPETDWDSIIASEKAILKPLEENLKRAQEAYNEQLRRVDLALDAKSHFESSQSNIMNTIQDYLYSRQQVLLKRAEHHQNLKAAGITVKTLQDLLPKKAPVDQVRLRKAGHGMVRK